VTLYHTGLFAADTPAGDVSVPCGAASYVIDGGLITGSEEEVRRKMASLQEERLGTFVASYDQGCFTVHNEVQISSEDLDQAYIASNALVAAMAVSDGNSTFIPDDQIDLVEVNSGPAPYVLGRQLNRPILLASKACVDRAIHYALHRLALSYRSASVHHVDLDPIESPRNFTSSVNPYVHVHLANAISLAYSAIEQLDLIVKASRDTPSRMEDGSLNPAVRKDLEERLKSRGIDIIEPQLWTLRGPPTVIEIKRPPPASKLPSRWRNPDVRDREVDLLECINDAGWFRNNFGFHGLSSELAPHVTIYDVFNVQHVARRLIMASAGLW
jgi:hypothetical protein